MPIILAVLILALLLGVFGFALHLLWVLAVIVLVVWMVGFVVRAAESGTRSRGRWYRW